MNIKKPLYTVPVPSTSFTTEAYFDGAGASPAIRFGYIENGAQHLGGISFRRILAVLISAESICKAWHIEDTYDTLVEVEDSPWIEELRADAEEPCLGRREIHHYMIYLDSVGCFEVIAESWSPNHESKKT
jgi:hypothetical protein